MCTIGPMSEMRVETIRQVRDHIADVVDRADREDSPTVITRRGKEVAAVVPIDLLRRYQQFEEQEIMRMVRERMGNPAQGTPMEEVMAQILEGPGEPPDDLSTGSPFGTSRTSTQYGHGGVP